MSAEPSSSSTSHDPEHADPRLAGRYALLEQIGKGGMGAVHRARDESTGRIVALKQLLSSEAGHKRRQLEAMFEREYHTLVRLRHPRIIEVYDYGVTDAGPFYTMELLDGRDLRQLAPLPYREACRHLRDVASSLALIHAHRLVHRDVSPRNVRLGSDGRAKLIDFGALVAFGPGASIIGTPMCIAPDVIRRMPLDQRTDLYALGVLAYFVLTERYPYPAQRFEELPAAWQRPPAMPSRLVPDLPAALDTLVMSLLQLDPLARPANAAVVIDQLTAIAELEPEDHEYAAASYLSSGRMVGRSAEQAWMENRLERVLAGSGSEVVIEGATGIGKTRLLHELCLQAQLRSLLVLKADGHATPGPFGVASTLALGLLGISPELARRTVAPHAALLAQLSPELRAKLDDVSAPAALNPAEHRAQLQAALYAWILEVARERPLLLAVDNVQAADDNSVAFLAAIGREARDAQLIVLVTQRSGEETVAPAPLRALRKRASRLTLAGLSRDACEELVASLFGDVAATRRLARLLYEKSAGNPQQCMDLAQLLIEKKIAKYVAGTWVLPLEVSAAELPDRAEEILAARLERLSPGARELADALSIYGKPVSIERCLLLVAGHGERELYAALDELVAAQVLLIEDESYRFAQGSLREVVLGRMDAAQRGARHLRSAEALLAAADARPEQRMEAGWHLLRAGEDVRGADLLTSTSREFLATRGGSQDVDQIVQAMRAALEVYERTGRSRYELAALFFTLLPLAFYTSDWRFIVRYGERVVRLGMEITGLALAYKLRHFLGRKLALKTGLLIAAVRFAREKRRGLAYDLRQAIAALCGAVPAANGVLSVLLDTPSIERMRVLVEPLALFGSDQFPSIMRDHIECILRLLQGREADSSDRYHAMIERYCDPRVRAAVGEGHWKSIYGGFLFTQAVVYCYSADPRALETATAMEELGVRTWATSAAQIRVLHHAMRGESEQVARYREVVELFAVQGGTTWNGDIFIPASALTGDVLAGDTLAARRAAEQLGRLSADAPSLRVFADAARAAYLMLRGELKPAIELYEQILPQLPPNRFPFWLSTRAFFAQALNWDGQYARAKQVLVEAFAHVSNDQERVLLMTLEAHRQLALAEAGLGNQAQAVRSIDALCAQYGQHDNPLLAGLLHKARAELALLGHDIAAFELHADAMERRFRATRNPALIAQCDRLAERARRHSVRRPDALSHAPEARPSQAEASATIARTLAELTASADRSEYALKLLMQRSEATGGYLYLLESGRLRLSAASHPNEPPRDVEAELQARVGRALAPIDEAEAPPADAAADAVATEYAPLEPSPAAPHERTQFVPSLPPDGRQGAYRIIVLMRPPVRDLVVVGAVLLDTQPENLFRLDQGLLDAVASALHGRAASE